MFHHYLHRSRAVTALFLLALLLGAGCATSTDNAPEQRNKPYLVLVSFDGFRWDYAALTKTPALDRMARNGLKAEALQPVFPTVTFPNHYSIASGTLPWRHGIVANDFPHENGVDWYHYKDRTTVQDGRWYLAEPIWVTAEKAGIRTAAYYFVGTEADVDGVRPSHWRPFDADVPGRARVNQVLDWLGGPEDSRPHLLTLYFERVDDHGHWYGPESEENMAAVRQLDKYLETLLDGIAALPHGDQVYVMVVSDHGQAAYGPHEPLVLDDWLDLEGSTVINGGPSAFIHIDNDDMELATAMRDVINRNWDCGRAYLPAELPPDWNAGASQRYPDLFVQADAGCGVITTESNRGRMTAGDHGWAPDVPEMRGIFYATGPRIPAGTRTGVVHVTDIFPMMLDILGLEAPGPVDGDTTALASRLLPEKG
jgi:predicted AlkP superfamily phosphohydrolase/phosphomutase